MTVLDLITALPLGASQGLLLWALAITGAVAIRRAR